MSRPDNFRRLSAIVLFAVLAVVARAANAQAPAPASPNATHPAPAASAAQPEPAQALTPEVQGDLYMVRKRYQAAIRAYKKIEEKSAVVWNKLGIAHQLMFNYYEAERCYRKSLKLDKKNASVMNNLATIYDAQKNYRSAERWYRKAIKAKPNSPLILKNLGTLLINRHKYKKGWKAYEAALALDPNIFARNSHYQVSNPTSVSDRGALNYFMARGCARAGLREQAIDYLRKSINEGYITPKKVAEDAEFSSLHGFPPFEQMLALQQKRP